MITRNNYEEYFLLYVDNELSAAERNAVEEFVQQNTDLANELSMIQGSVIKPESHIFFNNKESLFKNIETSSIINLNNYEEYFLLCIDNELDAATKKQVEEFVKQNPSLQNEWNILQKTKIEADHSIVFEGKESLYKKEERRRVVPFAWIASAAAVAVLLVTGFLLFDRTGNTVKNPSESIAKNNAASKTKVEDSIKPDVAVTSLTTDSLNKTKAENENVAIRQIKSEKQPAKSVEHIQKKIEKENKKEQKDLAVVNPTEENKTENTIEPVEAAKTTARIASTYTSSSEINVAPKKLVVLVDKPDEQFSTNGNENSYAISTTTVIEDPTNNDDSEKKNKLRGIFRRVSRVFNKNNDDDDSKRSVSIGSFQIALK